MFTFGDLLYIFSGKCGKMWFLGRNGRSRLNPVSSENHCLSLRALQGHEVPDEEENSSMSFKSIQLDYTASKRCDEFICIF